MQLAKKIQVLLRRAKAESSWQLHTHTKKTKCTLGGLLIRDIATFEAAGPALREAREDLEQQILKRLGRGPTTSK